MQTLILGRGEIGTALEKVLKQYNPIVKTKTNDKIDGVEIMHICFQYSKSFVKEVKRYQELYKPKFTVIHSTVPLGTNKLCNSISSPVVGVHPYLEESLKIFTKFLGGKKAGEVADYFRRAGMKVYVCDDSNTTELAKLSQTTQYALNIEYVKDLKKECDKYKVPFTENYNVGYNELRMPEYKLPLLIPIPTRQGGHCTLPNCKIWKTIFTKLILKLNPSK
jgi:UDP-N-acetyl-D-mannosaminuronate dehydrogenase